MLLHHSLKEVSRVLGVHMSTIYRHVKSGALPTQRILGQLRTSWEAVEQACPYLEPGEPGEDLRYRDERRQDWAVRAARDAQK